MDAQAPTPADRELHVLALNAGSSSLKFGLYRSGPSVPRPLLSGEAQALGTPAARFTAADARGLPCLHEDLPGLTATQALQRIGVLLQQRGLPAPQAVGHRVVHGGPALRHHARIDTAVLAQLAAAQSFAPLHTPAALALIHDAMARFAGVPHVACLDTCFHAQMPEAASRLPLPRALHDEGVQRYGFHGLSCESVVRQLGARLPPRLIVAHLGNGASITAVQHGASIDNSMGLTPSGGLIMGTRSGDIDPGVLIYLLREKKLDADGLEELIDRRSGLLGISGGHSDMRSLRAAAAASADAALAIEMFCRTSAKTIAAMCSVLGGVDMLVFTGGIGEHDAPTRADICSRLGCMGLAIDPRLNTAATGAGAAAIHIPHAACQVLVLPSQEDEQIARHVACLV